MKVIDPQLDKLSQTIFSAVPAAGAVEQFVLPATVTVFTAKARAASRAALTMLL